MPVDDVTASFKEINQVLAFGGGRDTGALPHHPRPTCISFVVPVRHY